MLIRSKAFAYHKRSLDVMALQNRGFVYLISRFDDDDSTICCFGSSQYRAQAPIQGLGGIAPVKLVSFKRKTKVKKTDVVHMGYEKVYGDEFPSPSSQQSVVSAPRQGGGHAEEIFIRKLPMLFDDFGSPRKVDVFISRIPCAQESSAWLYKTPKGRNVLLPEGCGHKLAVVARENTGITWRFWWKDAYPNANTQQACEKGLASLRGRAIVQRYTG